MRYFDKAIEDRFDELPDGRAVYYPQGRNGPGYLIPDQQTRARLERIYKAAAIAAAAASLLLAHVVNRSGNQYWLLALLMIPALQWYLGERMAERLTPIYEPVFAEEREGPVQEGSARSLWMIVAASVAASSGLFMTFVRRGPDSLGVLALAAAVLFAIPVPLALQELQRLREIARRRAEMFPSKSRLIFR